jgi:hypothetical protein
LSLFEVVPSSETLEALNEKKITERGLLSSHRKARKPLIQSLAGSSHSTNMLSVADNLVKVEKIHVLTFF